MSAGRAELSGGGGLRSRPRGWRATYQPDRRRQWWRLLLSSPGGLSSLVLLLAVVVTVLIGPALLPHSATHINPIERLRGPSSTHWLGTDDLGRDVVSRLVAGGRTSLLVGVLVMTISAACGTLIGLLAGSYRRLDGVLMRVMDGLMAFPGVLLAIAVIISLGARLSSIVLALTLVYTPVLARVVRGSTLLIRQLPYIEAAHVVGLGEARLMLRYILPNLLSPLIVQCSFVIAYAILAEASLSFLGAGIDPRAPSWGLMLRDGQRLLGPAPWLALAPGITLFVVVLACTVLGDALRDALDPRSRERRADGIAR